MNQMWRILRADGGTQEEVILSLFAARGLARLCQAASGEPWSLAMRISFLTLALLLAPIAHAWTWPAAGPVLQPFRFDPERPFGGGQHRGIDVGGAPDVQVRAPAAGKPRSCR